LRWRRWATAGHLERGALEGGLVFSLPLGLLDLELP
jgi:hypothetical protein